MTNLPSPERILCAHADQNGQGAHWLEPGETCTRATDVFGDDHPIIGEAVAWLQATDTVPLSRRAAQNLLPHWPHYPNLTDRERTAVLARFPECCAISTSLPEALLGRARAHEQEYRKRLDAHGKDAGVGIEQADDQR